MQKDRWNTHSAGSNERKPSPFFSPVSRTEQSIVNMVGRTVSYLRIRQDLACFEVANTQSVWSMITTVSVSDP